MSLEKPNIKLSHWLDLYPSLIVPGLRNSDENHWQSLWQSHLPNNKRVELDNWEQPDLAKWKAGIRQQLGKLNQPAVIIAHSFGTLASASIAAEFPEKIAALLLVAPADPDKFGIRHLLPQSPLPMPTKIIASSNDPWLTESKAAYLAMGRRLFAFKRCRPHQQSIQSGNMARGFARIAIIGEKNQTKTKQKFFN